MATASELVNYQGNAALGLGSNAAIPATGINTGVIDDTNKNIMLLNHENNVNKWKQKIQDRDKLYTLLDSDQVTSGNIDPKDQPAYDAAKKAHENAFFDMVNNGGIENSAAYAKYRNTTTDLKNTVTHLQARYLGFQALNKLKSETIVKAKQDAIQKFIDQQLEKPTSALVDPYQNSVDFNPAIYQIGQDKSYFGALSTESGSATSNGGVSSNLSNVNSATPAQQTSNRTTVTTKNGKQTVSKSQTTSPSKAGQVKGEEPVSGNIYYKPDGTAWSVSQSKFNFPDLLSETVEQYADPSSEEHEQQETGRKIYESMPNDQVMPVFKHIIQRVNDYNSDLGLKQGDAGYKNPTQIAQQLGIDPATGKRVRRDIGLATPEFTALMKLANYNGSYAPKSETFLKDVGDSAEKVRHDKAMEGANWERANAYANKAKFELDQAKSQVEKQKVSDGMYTRNLVAQKNLIEGHGDNKYAYASLPANKSTPVLTMIGNKPSLLQPIGSTPIYSKYNKDNTPTSDAKVIGYDGGHFDQQYTFNGRNLEVDGLENLYNNYVKVLKKKGAPIPQSGRDGFIKGLIGTEGSGLEVRLIGANGSTDKQLSLAALQAISNSDTKKGQESPFNSDDIPSGENTSESFSGESSSTQSTTIVN